MDPVSVRLIIALAILHAVGLIAAWATRLARSPRIEAISQVSFFAAMGGIGLSACFCCQIELGFSVPSGVTLMAMVLMAVADFRPTHEPAGRILR
jgi:hypothetical protein